MDLSLLRRGDWGWHACEDTESRAQDVKNVIDETIDVIDGTMMVSLVSQPFKLTRNAFTLLYWLQHGAGSGGVRVRRLVAEDDEGEGER